MRGGECPRVEQNKPRLVSSLQSLYFSPFCCTVAPVVLSPGTRISSFSQGDLASRRVRYVHTSETEKHRDAFSFSVSDGTHEVKPSEVFCLDQSRLLSR